MSGLTALSRKRHRTDGIYEEINHRHTYFTQRGDSGEESLSSFLFIWNYFNLVFIDVDIKVKQDPDDYDVIIKELDCKIFV